MRMMLKRLAFNKLPPRYSQWLRRKYLAWQLKRGKFVIDPVEQHAINQLLAEGDWVLDIGANVSPWNRFRKTSSCWQPIPFASLSRT